MNKRLVVILIASFFIMHTLMGCEERASVEKSVSAASAKESVIKPANSKPQKNEPVKEIRLASRTWAEIKASGYINAVRLNLPLESGLPRSGSTGEYHSSLMTDFAESENLKINWISVDNLAEMFKQLATFSVDIIPRHLTITPKRSEKFHFTYPLLRDKEVVIAQSSVNSFDEESEIVIHVPVGSAFIESIKIQYPHWKIAIVEENVSAQRMVDSLSEGKFKYTVIDGFALETLKQYRDDIDSVYTLPKAINLAWAVNQGSPQLLHQLNEFISVHHVMQVIEPERTIDFKALKKSKQPLRVITRNSPETYFLWRGELRGFEYELMKRFADIHKVKLVVVVADSYEHMLTLLAEGKGDVIAAGLSKTSSRTAKLAEENLVTSIRYNRVKEQLVAHIDGPDISTLEDLKGRTIKLRKTSSFWESAQSLKKEYGVDIVIADEDESTEILIEQVANKMADLTLADSNLTAIELSHRDNIITPLTFKDNIPYTYILRQNNPELLAYLNTFIRKHYRGTFYNVVKNRYFKNKKLQKSYKEHRLVQGSTLSPYDDLVRELAPAYNFDWRLIVSQMYQESRFNPLATNSTGAFGLMQMLPRTAAELGVKDLKDPEQAIASGVKYLNWTRERFSRELPVQEQIFFSLASYNAGYGHVKDAQRVARQQGLRSDKWFNNVEKAMLLLQKRQYYKKARFGYVRGHEPVNYVRDIHQRYLSYIRVTD